MNFAIWIFFSQIFEDLEKNEFDDDSDLDDFDDDNSTDEKETEGFYFSYCLSFLYKLLVSFMHWFVHITNALIFFMCMTFFYSINNMVSLNVNKFSLNRWKKGVEKQGNTKYSSSAIIHAACLMIIYTLNIYRRKGSDAGNRTTGRI